VNKAAGFQLQFTEKSVKQLDHDRQDQEERDHRLKDQEEIRHDRKDQERAVTGPKINLATLARYPVQ
jgi:hypothetical protein